MDDFWKIIIGLIATFLLGTLVDPLLKSMKNRIELPPPKPDLKSKWDAITSNNENDNSGEILGRLERLLFFIAFFNESLSIIGFWLAFKVGSKWQVWSNITSVPKELEDVDPLDYLYSRRRWSAQRLMSFLIGTLSNILVAFFGYLIGKYFFETLKLLCQLT